VTVTPPALAQLALTTDETTPSCDGKLVARSASLTIKEATTLKAVSCKGNTASLIVTKKFEILPGPVVIVSFQIYGSVSAADLSDDMKNDFVGALVEMLRLPSRDLVQDITVKDARRRLLAVDLSLGILTNGDDSADDLQNSIKNTDFGSLTNRAGWSDAAVAGVEVSVLQPDGTAPPTTPPPAKKTAWPVMVAGVVGAVVALTLMATGSFYFYRRGVERKTQTENKLSPASSDVNALDPADLQPSILEEYDCSQDDHVKPEMSTTSLEQRIMGNDSASVASDEEIELGMDQARGEFVFVESVQEALGIFNLMLPWQQKQEQPKADEDEILAEAASLGGASSTADAKLKQGTLKLGDQAGLWKDNKSEAHSEAGVSVASRQASYAAGPSKDESAQLYASNPSIPHPSPDGNYLSVQSAPSAPAPSIEDQTAVLEAPGTPPESDPGTPRSNIDAHADLTKDLEVVQTFPRYPRLVTPRSDQSGVGISHAAPVQLWKASDLGPDQEQA